MQNRICRQIYHVPCFVHVAIPLPSLMLCECGYTVAISHVMCMWPYRCHFSCYVHVAIPLPRPVLCAFGHTVAISRVCGCGHTIATSRAMCMRPNRLYSMQGGNKLPPRQWSCDYITGPCWPSLDKAQLACIGKACSVHGRVTPAVAQEETHVICLCGDHNTALLCHTYTLKSHSM